MRQVLRDALAAWRKLPEPRRNPGAIQVAPLDGEDAQFIRRPPAGLILNVWTRALDRLPSGEFQTAACDPGQGGEASRDHAWITADEARTLLPQDLKPGHQYPLPRKLAMRLTRFHLVDNTRGEPPSWEQEDLHSCDLALRVEEATSEKIRLSLRGDVLLATSPFLLEAKRGFKGKVHGELVYDRTKSAWERINITVLGQHWGEGPFTQGGRPGRSWLGVAMELSPGDKPMDCVPPQGIRDQRDYWGR
jgi:hypothetical protein